MYRRLSKVYSIFEKNGLEIDSLPGKTGAILKPDRDEGMLEEKFRVVSWPIIQYVRPNVGCDVNETTLLTIFLNDPLYSVFIVKNIVIESTHIRFKGSVRNENGTVSESFVTLKIKR